MEKSNAFKTIFESAIEGVIVSDQKGTVIIANPAATELFGYKKGDLIGLNVESLVPDESRKKHKSYRREYRKDPHPRGMGHGRDLIGQKKDGAVFPVEVSLNALEIDGENVVVAFIVDITDRKEAEEALRHSEEKLLVYAAELEKRVKERTKELANANKNLERINKELQDEINAREIGEREVLLAYEREKELSDLKSRFVSLASHEFRTPLSTILSSTSLIEKYNSEDTFLKKQKHIQRIKNNIQVLTGLLNDFLNLQKMEEGKVAPEYTEFVFEEFIEEVVDEMRLLVKNGQTISTKIDSKIGSIHIDRNMLKNICNNLLSNAVKYSSENKAITIRCKKAGTNLKLEVEDQGIGIPHSDQRHMFMRFFRAKNASGIQGTGLGLYIVKKYIDQLKGSITFKTRLENGTKFLIELPLNND